MQELINVLEDEEDTEVADVGAWEYVHDLPSWPFHVARYSINCVRNKPPVPLGSCPLANYILFDEPIPVWFDMPVHPAPPAPPLPMTALRGEKPDTSSAPFTPRPK